MGLSALGGWDGEGIPKHGDYVRPRPHGNDHIVLRSLGLDHAPNPVLEMACRKKFWVDQLVPGGGEEPERPCFACWEAM